ncbi:hypothetical protein QR680_007048 [Steinernema hermaphroditum]|uniref:C2H2-type domain-containing protein n=1 Tax=Steinernema hermaphroditum TaxID=289476 RepID=A0AA39HZN6_9BILA|nr:hypothetical protein QR680_007048 [Steinernema hermaphroditum]
MENANELQGIPKEEEPNEDTGDGSSNDSFGDDDSIHDYSYTPLQDPELLLAAYTRAFNIRMMKSQEEKQESADEAYPVESRELAEDDLTSKPQPPQRENRVTPDQAVFNYLYHHKRSDLLETMFDQETCVEYTNKVEKMGAAIPQIQRLYAYYRRQKPVKKEAVEESSDSRRGVVELDNEESGNDDPKRRPQSTPTENGPIHLNDSAVLMLNAEATDKRTSPSDLKITPQLAIFYYLHEQKRRDVLEAIFDEDTRKVFVRKVEKMGIDMPSILRMYACWRRIELKKTVKRGIEIWLKMHALHADHLDKKQYHKLRRTQASFYKKAEAQRNKYFPPEAFLRFDDKKMSNKNDLEDPTCRECRKVVHGITTRRSHVAQHLNLSYKCVVEGCMFRADPSRAANHLTRHHSKKVAHLTATELFELKRIRTDFKKVMEEELHKFFPYKDDIPAGPIRDRYLSNCMIIKQFQDLFQIKMDILTPPSAQPFNAHGLIYNFVKAEIRFFFLRCSEKNGVEKLQKLYDKNTLKSMVEVHKKSKRTTKAAKGDEDSIQERAEAKIKRTGSSDLKIIPQLATFYYLYERKRRDVLEAIFGEETRKEFASRVEKMGIDMSSILRMYTYWRRIELKKTIKNGIELWKRNHALHADHLDKEQYHKLRRTQASFYKKARTKLKKYFPPEAFLRFDDKKMSNKNLLEDPKCRECGKMVHGSTTRRYHVAQHLKLLYKCAADGCEFRTDPIHMPYHLSKNHSKKVAQLTAEELFELKCMRMDFEKMMEGELHKFFSYKDDILAALTTPSPPLEVNQEPTAITPVLFNSH